jgi:hypothetical protein
MGESHQVFISYSHDTPQHKQAVLDLANHLREDGVDAWLDQYEPAPAEGWPRWMEQQIEGAKFVLLVCTEKYHDRVKMRAKQGTGLGALWEGNLIYQSLYESGTINEKFIPLLPLGGKDTNIPGPLRGSQHYSPFSEPGYTELYRRLTGQPAVVIPKLGPQKKLPPHTMPAGSPLQMESATTIACTTSRRAAIILPDERSLAFPPVVSSQWNKDEAHFLLEPDVDDPDSAGLLATLRGQRHNIYLAYKNNAGVAYPGQVEQITNDGRERWQVAFHLNKTDFSQVMEFNSPDLTADEAAVLRAKRLLLNEQPSKPSGRRIDTMTELQIAGQGTNISIKESPFPKFLKTADMRTQDNLEAAWIYTVLHLKLSGTIEHVSRLELALQGDKLDVTFSGRRPKKYSNEPAFQIEFSGTCSLAGCQTKPMF